MTRSFTDVTNQQFGGLIALEKVGSNRGNVLWKCKCIHCGQSTIVRYCNLKKLPKACGCKRPPWHGHATGGKTPTYISWVAMKDRCYQRTHKDYHNYGGRGVRVSKKWKNSFATFLLDMGERPQGTTLDRIDPNGHYVPSNCRWATKFQQAHNKRRSR